MIELSEIVKETNWENICFLFYWCVFTHKTLGDDVLVAGLYWGWRTVWCVFSLRITHYTATAAQASEFKSLGNPMISTSSTLAQKHRTACR